MSWRMIYEQERIKKHVIKSIETIFIYSDDANRTRHRVCSMAAVVALFLVLIYFFSRDLHTQKKVVNNIPINLIKTSDKQKKII